MLNIISYFVVTLSAVAALEFGSEREARDHLSQKLEDCYGLEALMQLAGRAHLDLAMHSDVKQGVEQVAIDNLWKDLQVQNVVISAATKKRAENIGAIDLLTVGMQKALSGWEGALVTAARALANPSLNQAKIEQVYQRLIRSEKRLILSDEGLDVRGDWDFAEPRSLGVSGKKMFSDICQDLRYILQCDYSRVRDILLMTSLRPAELVRNFYKVTQQKDVTDDMLKRFRVQEVMPFLKHVYLMQSGVGSEDDESLFTAVERAEENRIS